MRSGSLSQNHRASVLAAVTASSSTAALAASQIRVAREPVSSRRATSTPSSGNSIK